MIPTNEEKEAKEAQRQKARAEYRQLRRQLDEVDVDIYMKMNITHKMHILSEKFK